MGRFLYVVPEFLGVLERIRNQSVGLDHSRHVLLAVQSDSGRVRDRSRCHRRVRSTGRRTAGRKSS